MRSVYAINQLVQARSRRIQNTTAAWQHACQSKQHAEANEIKRHDRWLFLGLSVMPRSEHSRKRKKEKSSCPGKWLLIMCQEGFGLCKRKISRSSCQENRSTPSVALRHSARQRGPWLLAVRWVSSQSSLTQWVRLSIDKLKISPVRKNAADAQRTHRRERFPRFFFALVPPFP